VGKVSRSPVARICVKLHERFEEFKARSLYDTSLVGLFLDAIFLPVRRRGAIEFAGPLRVGQGASSS
jgi:transposase-like protein